MTLSIPKSRRIEYYIYAFRREFRLRFRVSISAEWEESDSDSE